jgi:hypothetical protein
MSRNKAGLLTGIGITTLALAAWLFASPYVALSQLRSAAQEGDVEQLSELVDFPSVRENLKADLKAHMIKELAQEEDNPFAGLGLMIANSMVDVVVEGMVSPSGISALARSATPDVTPGQQSAVPEPQPESGADTRIERGYDGPNEFVVNFRDTKTAEKGPALVLRRDGFGWKLARVELPQL